MVGVWIDPVIAQLMMVLFAMVVPPGGRRPVDPFIPRQALRSSTLRRRSSGKSASSPLAGGESSQILPARRRGFTLYSKFCRLSVICLGTLSAAFLSPHRLRRGYALHIG
jgi:hypothetical protein